MSYHTQLAWPLAGVALWSKSGLRNRVLSQSSKVKFANNAGNSRWGVGGAETETRLEDGSNQGGNHVHRSRHPGTQHNPKSTAVSGNTVR